MRKGVVVLMYVFIGCFQSVSNSIDRPVEATAGCLVFTMEIIKIKGGSKPKVKKDD